MNLRPADVVSYLAYVALFALAVVSGTRGPLWYAGLAASSVCAVLWVIARTQLGDSFSVGAEARHLVTHGLYAKLRHPIYMFGTMAFLFVVLALQGVSALVIWAIVLAVQFLRARREDAVLARAFGSEYEAYRSRTWF